MEISEIFHLPTATLMALLGAFIVAITFEAVNGFHDAANAVATVIYTNSLRPRVAVVLSGIFNFLG
ncbi:MAG: inorganic phosphate transporter, partial [Deltaproteobacteria bacterium]|nr:inorganic phosphate transporter [Deltaproteobacteria bacterium]